MRLLAEHEGAAVELRNAQARGPVLLVCEHASAAIPERLGDLGLAPEARFSHAAWDLGALALADRLSRLLDAPLVAARWSRLVHDCNRPPDAPDAIADTSEIFEIPGNRALPAEARASRAAEFYAPFHAEVARVLAAIADPVLVTVHSFTPIYRGRPRRTEIGILHDADSRLADRMLDASEHGALARYEVRRNDPYGPQDGVTHTLVRHALPRGLLNVMIEVRNDLIGDAERQEIVANALAAALVAALEPVGAVPGN